MLKLRYLFNNADLAEMLLQNWEHDQPSSQLFSFFRISSNATYPFRRAGQTCFLRFCPTPEKPPEAVVAELDFIRYLRSNGYNAPETIPSKSGSELLQKETPWGNYLATAFKSSGDKPLNEVDLQDEVVFAFGKALGALHRLSRRYGDPKVRRWSHLDALNWIAVTLKDASGQELPLTELTLLRQYFSSIPKDPSTYGLVHYDFELDNVFFEPVTASCSAIDFDDAMYHWYIMDIEQTLDSLTDHTTEADFQHKKTVFLNGYCGEFPLQDNMLHRLPTFRRFANLYSYTRILRSVQETWENEPEWMQGLRNKLSAALRSRSALFGTPIEA